MADSTYKREQHLQEHGITIRRATNQEQQTNQYGEKLIWVVDLGGHRQARTGEQVPPPQSDDEALRLLDYQESMLTQITRNLYHVYRLQGHDVFVAYTKTLESLVDAHKANTRQP